MSLRHALIMAAGRGQRMMPLTEYVPKPMIALNGISLIARGIDRLRDAIPNIHITVGYKGAMLAEHVIEHRVSTVINTDGRSNSWWVYNTLMTCVDEPVLVLTCDNVVDLDFERLIEDYHARGQPACMLVPVQPIEGLEGDFIFQVNGMVSEINRHKTSEIYCSGIQILNPAKVAHLTAFEAHHTFYDLWNQLIPQRELVCSRVYPKMWIGIDNLEQLHNARNA